MATESLCRTDPALLRQHGVHVLVRDGLHHFNVGVVTVHPLLVDGDVLSVQQLRAGGVLTYGGVERERGVLQRNYRQAKIKYK